jgi:hypothetical protein
MPFCIQFRATVMIVQVAFGVALTECNASVHSLLQYVWACPCFTVAAVHKRRLPYCLNTHNTVSRTDGRWFGSMRGPHWSLQLRCCRTLLFRTSRREMSWGCMRQRHLTPPRILRVGATAQGFSGQLLILLEEFWAPAHCLSWRCTCSGALLSDALPGNSHRLADRSAFPDTN